MSELPKYSRGSEWRKWDLQACTNFYSQYKGPTFSANVINKLHEITGVEKEKIRSAHKPEQISNGDYAKIYIEYLVHFTDIDVVAITNHNTGEGIDEILDYLDRKKDYADPENIYNRLTIFPGVEIGCEDRCHVLLIFNPNTEVKHKFKHDQNGNVTGEKNWKEYISDFLNEIEIREPRFSTGQEPHNSTSKGVGQVLSHARKWDFIPIFPHINENNGWWKELQISTRRTTFQHKMFGIVDSGSVGTNQNLLRVLNGKDASFGSKKIAKIHTSDANRITDIGKKYTWIKADPTFEGLKQVIYEPEERVRIQTDNPIEDHTKYTLDVLDIQSSKAKLLEPQKIFFNRNLVSIIGGKGAGKSSLLALVANASEAYDPHPVFEDKKTEVEFRFLDKNSKAQVFPLDVSGVDNGQTLPILYIAQEELAKASTKKAGVRQAYLKEIGVEDVSINYADISIKIDSLLNQISEQEKIIIETKKKVGYMPRKHGGDFEKFLKESIGKQEKTIKLTSTKSTKEIIESITEIIKKGRQLSQWLKGTDFTKIENEIGVVNKTITVLNKQLEDLGISERIEEVDITKQKHQFDSIKEKVEKEIKSSRKSYLGKKEKLEAAGIKEDVPTLLKTLETVQNELTLFEESQKKFNEARQTIDSLRKEVAEFYKQDSVGGVLREIEEAKKHIEEVYSEFYSQREGSKIFEDLFQDIEIEAKVFFNISELEKEITDCFFKDHIKDIKKEIFGDSKPTYKNYFKWVSNEFWDFYSEKLDGNNFKTRLVGEELDGRSKILEIVFRRWFDYIKVSTAIINDFSGRKKEINEMSTGELATVLLKLKLVTEGLDRQIILLDQPEDHLDNDFIANGLVKLIKELKKERQVIVATHNANLVIGADSEQVIVANFDQSNKEYFSGSLENPLIREKVINILEGGHDAFEKRANRYDLAS